MERGGGRGFETARVHWQGLRQGKLPYLGDEANHTKQVSWNTEVGLAVTHSSILWLNLDIVSCLEPAAQHPG